MSLKRPLEAKDFTDAALVGAGYDLVDVRLHALGLHGFGKGVDSIRRIGSI